MCDVLIAFPKVKKRTIFLLPILLISLSQKKNQAGMDDHEVKETEKEQRKAVDNSEVVYDDNAICEEINEFFKEFPSWTSGLELGWASYNDLAMVNAERVKPGFIDGPRGMTGPVGSVGCAGCAGPVGSVGNPGILNASGVVESWVPPPDPPFVLPDRISIHMRPICWKSHRDRPKKDDSSGSDSDSDKDSEDDDEDNNKGDVGKEEIEAEEGEKKTAKKGHGGKKYAKEQAMEEETFNNRTQFVRAWMNWALKIKDSKIFEPNYSIVSWIRFNDDFTEQCDEIDVINERRQAKMDKLHARMRNLHGGYSIACSDGEYGQCKNGDCYKCKRRTRAVKDPYPKESNIVNETRGPSSVDFACQQGDPIYETFKELGILKRSNQHYYVWSGEPLPVNPSTSISASDLSDNNGRSSSSSSSVNIQSTVKNELSSDSLKRCGIS